MSDEQTRLHINKPLPEKSGNLDDVGTKLKLARIPGKLTVVDGAGDGQTFKINDSCLTIGRDPSNDIPLNFGDDTVHRKTHAAIEYLRNGEFHVHNVKGVNPVALNGEEFVGIRKVAFGDLIRVGMTTLRLDPP